MRWRTIWTKRMSGRQWRTIFLFSLRLPTRLRGEDHCSTKTKLRGAVALPINWIWRIINLNVKKTHEVILLFQKKHYLCQRIFDSKLIQTTVNHLQFISKKIISIVFIQRAQRQKLVLTVSSAENDYFYCTVFPYKNEIDLLRSSNIVSKNR